MKTLKKLAESEFNDLTDLISHSYDKLKKEENEWDEKIVISKGLSKKLNDEIKQAHQVQKLFESINISDPKSIYKAIDEHTVMNATIHDESFIGEIKVFPYNFAPRGWCFCEGQIMPIAENEALFSLLGVMYGGDGRTTFALPDLREQGKVLGMKYCIYLSGMYPSRN